MDDSLRVLRVEVQNFKRLRFVRWEPDPGAPVLRVAGPNGSGKTSVLDAITCALAGAKHVPPEPLRRGEREARIRVELGPLVIERRWHVDPRTEQLVSDPLRVTDVRSGHGVRQPQRVLSALYSELTFEPLRFLAMAPRAQVETLRQVVGLDFAALDRDREQLYSDRAYLNRQMREAQAELGTIERHPGVEPVDVQAIAAELERALEQQSALEGLRQQVAALERAAARARHERERVAAQLRALDETIERTEGEHAQARTAAAGLEQARVDPAPIREALREAEATNAKARANQRFAELERRCRELHRQSDARTHEMTQIDLRKEQEIAAASFPVRGLGFGLEGLVTFEGLPLEQASHAQRLRVAIGIGAALNPRLRVVLVRDGSLLDSQSLALLRSEMVARDMQAWVEVVAEDGEGDEGTLLLCDGEQAAAA